MHCVFQCYGWMVDVIVGCIDRRNGRGIVSFTAWYVSVIIKRGGLSWWRSVSSVTYLVPVLLSPLLEYWAPQLMGLVAPPWDHLKWHTLAMACLQWSYNIVNAVHHSHKSANHPDFNFTRQDELHTTRPNKHTFFLLFSFLLWCVHATNVA